MTGQFLLRISAELLEEIRAIPNWTDNARQALLEMVKREKGS
jgi:hypothetical protein